MTTDTPKALGFTQPAEWLAHDAVWLAWPSADDLWEDNLTPAQQAFARMCHAITGPANQRGERVELLVPEEREAEAREALEGVDVRVHHVAFGDIWLRDTAPIFVRNGNELAAVRFGFNGWGGKYVLDHDDQVSARIAEISGLRTFVAPLVLEGGSVDVDGEGLCLTTRECLLNKNRNPSLSSDRIESLVRDYLGVDELLWLGDGLANDHTDGHVDNIARFVAPNTVVCMAPSGDDPNREVLLAIQRDLRAMKPRGRSLEVITIPSPGRILNDEGKVVPASSVNFYIGNRCVVVPLYGSAWDDDIVRALEKIFTGREVVGIPSNAILTGGGSFHCISQQQPRLTSAAAR